MEELKSMDDWEDRLKALLCKFREDNMLDYRRSDEYRNNQEKMHNEFEKIEKLGLSREAMDAIQEFGDIENAAGTDYMEQAYIQGISDGIRLLRFFNQIGA